MAVSVGSVGKVLVLKYHRHAFYENVFAEDAPLIHIDPKGRELFSNCFDEDEAMEWVDSYESNKGEGIE